MKKSKVSNSKLIITSIGYAPYLLFLYCQILNITGMKVEKSVLDEFMKKFNQMPHRCPVCGSETQYDDWEYKC